MNRFGKNVLITSGTTLVSRLLGFARDAAMAWLLGAGPVADALSVALRLPWAGRRLLGEGSLSMGLSVVCTGHNNPCKLALAVGKKLFWPAVVLLAGLLCCTTALVDMLAPGASETVRDEAAFLLRLTLPYLLFAGGAACCMAGMHAKGRFVLPGLMPSLFNVLMLSFAAVAALCTALYATNALFAATLLAAGVLVGGLIQWLVLLWAAKKECRRAGDPVPISATHSTLPLSVHAALRCLPAGIFGASVPQMCFVLAGVFASWQGDMAALFYAERLLEFPLGVLGAAVGMAAVPELRAQDRAGSMPVTTRVLEWTLALHVAAGAGLAAVSEPLVALLYGHGAFNAEAVARTAYCLQIYACCLPAYAVSRPLLAACQLLGYRSTINSAAVAGLVACGLVGLLSLLPPNTSFSLEPFSLEPFSLKSFFLTPFFCVQAFFVQTGPALCVVAGLSVQALWLWGALFRRAGLRVPMRRIAVNIPAACVVYFAATTVLRAYPSMWGLGLAILAGVGAWSVLCALVLWGNVLPQKTL